MERAKGYVSTFNQDECEQCAQEQHPNTARDKDEYPSVLDSLVTQLDEFDTRLFSDGTPRSEDGQRWFTDESSETGLGVVVSGYGQDGASR